jgi:hypothetical protein
MSNATLNIGAQPSSLWGIYPEVDHMVTTLLFSQIVHFLNDAFYGMWTLSQFKND